MSKKQFRNTIILLIIAAFICAIPVFIIKDSEFGGADGEAEGVIEEVDPSYEPWFDSIWAPPGGETESLLFALQAAIGAGVICYFIGYMKGQNSKDASKENTKKGIQTA